MWLTPGTGAKDPGTGYPVATKDRQRLLGKQLVAKDVGWSLAPLINSGGRMGEPDRAVRLFLEHDAAVRRDLADALVELNERRRKVGKNYGKDYELRRAPWLGWIQDLSAKDPYYITPILMTATMWLQQKLAPQAGDPQQQKIMRMLPLIFGIMFLQFPSGLVLYWLVNNIISMSQQYYIQKKA